MLFMHDMRVFRAIHAVDTRLFHRVFRTPRYPALPGVARIVSRSADGWLYPCLVPIIWWFGPGQPQSLLLGALLGFSAERALYYLLKLSFKRRRPPNSLVGVHPFILAPDEFSLPSGHTSAAFFVATFLCLGISPVFLPLYGWAAMVGVSRVILGVHFPTDILAGSLIGTTLAVAVT